MPDRMPSLRSIGLGLAVALLALLLTLPMRLVLSVAGLADRGFAVRSVRGPIWAASLRDVRIGEIALGDIDAAVSPLPLLIGSVHLAFRSDMTGAPENATAQPLNGTLEFAWGKTGIRDFSGVIDPGAAFAPLPMLRLAFTHATAVVRRGNCLEASGQVTATLAAGLVAVPALTLPRTLSGTLACRDGKLALEMASDARTETVKLSMLDADRYRAGMTIATDDAALGDQLTQAGFINGDQGYRLSVDGRF